MRDLVHSLIYTRLSIINVGCKTNCCNSKTSEIYQQIDGTADKATRLAPTCACIFG